MDGRRNASPTAPVVLDDRTRRSYRYLRASVVGMALLLVVSLALELLRSGDAVERFGSISGYYYSPVRSVFVGALVAIGPALIAIKGRPGWEDTLLDLAGMLVPVVALVPTPRLLGEDRCGEGLARCVPPDLIPAVRNNVTTLIVVGAVVLAFAWWSARRAPDRTTMVGVRWAALTWVLFTGWFVLLPELFLRLAHYAAAVPFFALIAAFALLSGRRAPARTRVRFLTPERYSVVYRTVSGLMIATIVLTLLYYGGGLLLDYTPWSYTIFVVEAVLLVLFVVFWSFQTAENWDLEANEDSQAAHGV